MKRAFRWIAFSSVIVSLLGCNGGLNRAKIERETRALPMFTEPSIIVIEIGRLGEPCGQPTSTAEYAVLQHAGAITISREGKYSQVALTDVGRRVIDGFSEGPYGHTESKGCSYDQVNVPVAKREFGGITGIRRRSDDVVEAEFDFSWKLTEIGEALRKEKIGGVLKDNDLAALELNRHLAMVNVLSGAPRVPIDDFSARHGSSTATFVRYDDGWRWKPAQD